LEDHVSISSPALQTPPSRCAWCGSDPLYTAYHDLEWGVPLHDDRALFELLILEGAQAGLSWITILRKRERYRLVFHGFDAARIARYDAADVQRLLGDAGIVRNRLKIEGTIRNARAVAGILSEAGSLDAYFWRFVDGMPVQNRWRSLRELPPQTPASERLSRDLRSRGMTFVGPTICYAFMQAAGLVNDHTTDCFRHRELGGRG
jgi:DNA-3-methyladenine glycosylase I